MEAAWRPKSFVLKMELFPKAEILRMHTLTMYGVRSQDVPISDLIPITKYDYWCASWKFWTKQNTVLDLDMIYANRINKDMFLFGKTGQWHDEGINHEALSMEKTYNEDRWYDQWNVSNFV